MFIEAHHERERRSTVGRVIAICKVLSKGDPLEGLREAKRAVGGLSKASAMKRWLFGGGADDE